MLFMMFVVMTGEQEVKEELEDGEYEEDEAVIAELDELGTGVKVVSSRQVEDDILRQLKSEGAVDENYYAGGIDEILGEAEQIQLGEKTPFEIEREEDGELSSDGEVITSDEEEFLPSEDEDLEIPSTSTAKPRKKKATTKRSKLFTKSTTIEDDSADDVFEKRIRAYRAQLELDRIEGKAEDDGTFKTIKGDYKLASYIWNALFKYQKSGLRWLKELHDMSLGGILADEMGLGKTIQILAFLRMLDDSQLEDPAFNVTGLGSVLIMCPTTIMRQWVKEIHKWMPLCRVAVYHSSASYKGSMSTLLRKMAVNRKGGSIVITSYGTFTKSSKEFLKKDWHYVILDEGHQIRNPESKISIAARELHTSHRLILSGSPLQNSLREIWTLIEFVYPGRLGALKAFTESFVNPIRVGGYQNATEVQKLAAYKCSTVLRDAIQPYILRRTKKNMQSVLNLPDKEEEILTCELTYEQRRFYKDFLESRECARILKGSADAFAGLITLRKLCNHPDLTTGGPNKYGDLDLASDPTNDFGWYERSGKMLVAKVLLNQFKKSGSKVLLFSQSRQMLCILEKFLILQGYSYLRMDGQTSINTRQRIVEDFNNNPDIFVFLLTTKVGGLGLNLIGANKVVIFDPDWNPSTDAQARERAWRIGQQREVKIYRLLLAGTIEEKMYHRQIYKQFLANRVLKNPKQQQFFKSSDLHELFTLKESDNCSSTETGALFATETTEITRENFFDKLEKERSKTARKSKKAVSNEEEENELDDGETMVELTEERRQQLRELAKKLASDPKLVEEEKPSTDDTGDSKRKSKKKKKKKENDLSGLPYIKKHKKVKVKKEDADTQNETDYIMKSLMKTGNVRSIIKHDHIIKEKQDLSLIEKEADLVAKQAANVVKSRKRPKETSFMDSLRRGARAPEPVRQKDEEDDGSSRKKSKKSFMETVVANKQKTLEDVNFAGSSNKKVEEMVTKTVDFMKQNGGSIHSDTLCAMFNKNYNNSVEEQFQFRSVLLKIAKFGRERKLWTLRSDYSS